MINCCLHQRRRLTTLPNRHLSGTIVQNSDGRFRSDRSSDSDTLISDSLKFRRREKKYPLS
ncbi:hypothetical protein IGI04_034354 [Brassica rapa subsp. trilocularis]|uniref:Uncharacterized protein n=1 Tax=Brassica rapa subsp. trilocularis TaxID=1813537 RepID=A0ABQ7L8G4_BRACM|nr:hypothetical protein IGI04_034354 [Brassica rapa subsp. trilocularis]